MAAAISADRLGRRFGDLEAVRDVSFEVAEGEAFGFLGPNGAGKSTTINMLCTLLRPSSGRAAIAGLDVTEQPLAVRREIGLVFQDTTLDDYLTAAENLRFHAELYGVDVATREQRLDAVLEMVGLMDRRDDLVGNFSGGMLFLDEPTIGLDPQTRTHIWAYIDELRRREQITIFLTTHYMDEAEHCDRLAIIDNGSLVAVDTPDALKARIGEDRIELHVDEPAAAIRELKRLFRLDAQMSEGAVVFHVAGGEQFVPRLFAELTVPVQAIRVARPTLDDVFMTYTGRTIRDAEATATDRIRSHHRRWQRTR